MASTYPPPPPQPQPIIINNNPEPPPPPPPENVTIINNQVPPTNQVHPVQVGQPVNGVPVDPYGYHAKGVRFCYRCQQNRWVYTEPRYTPGTILCCILCPIIGWIVCLTNALMGNKLKCTVCHSQLQ